MLAEQQRRSLGDDVQYLTDRQLEQLVEQMPDKDIKDYEDLQSGEWAPRWREAGGGVQGEPWEGAVPCFTARHLSASDRQSTWRGCDTKGGSVG